MSGEDLTTLGGWSYGIATVGFVALALRLAAGRRPGLRAQLLLAAVVLTALWSAAALLLLREPGPLTWVALSTADVLRYAAWFLFLGALLQGEHASLRNLPGGALPRAVVALVAIVLVASLVVLPQPPFMSLRTGTATPGFALRVAMPVLGLFLMEQLLRGVDPPARWALKPLAVALAGVFAFDLYYFSNAMLFQRIDADLWVARGAANALVLPFLVVATRRNPGLAVGMHVSRGAVLHTTAVLVSGTFLLLVAGAGYFVRYMGGEWGRALQVLFFFAALLTGMLVVSSGRFRSQLRVFVGKHFFPYRYDYREEWLRFTRTLGAGSGVRDVQEQVIRALADLVESPAGALWLRAEDGSFRQEARLNATAPEGVERADGPLAAFLDRTGWVVDLHERDGDPERYPELTVPSWLAEWPAAWLVIPLPGVQELTGFVVLARPRVALEVNWEVRDLLKVASRQAATYLAQVRATEALVDARKFEAFNRMSAFVVHDLKNLVSQLSLMLRNAERHRDNPEFQRDMLATVEHVVGRMQHLMLQLQAGATPLGKPRALALDALVRSVCALRGAERARISLDLIPGVTALGHEDRLEHVIGHLLQNALDATAAGGRVGIRVYRQDEHAVVEVSDTGVGMDADFMRSRLMKPFETSKPSGMGIGVYESAQYVAALRGRILFDSTPAVGTRVRVLLPASDSAQPAAPAEAAA